MAYVKRKNGKVARVTSHKMNDGDEYLDDDHSDIVAYDQERNDKRLERREEYKAITKEIQSDAIKRLKAKGKTFKHYKE